MMDLMPSHFTGVSSTLPVCAMIPNQQNFTRHDERFNFLTNGLALLGYTSDLKNAPLFQPLWSARKIKLNLSPIRFPTLRLRWTLIVLVSIGWFCCFCPPLWLERLLYFWLYDTNLHRSKLITRLHFWETSFYIFIHDFWTVETKRTLFRHFSNRD